MSNLSTEAEQNLQYIARGYALNRTDGSSADDIEMEVAKLTDWAMEQIEAYAAQKCKEARIDENQRLIASIDKNKSDKYPVVDENNSLTYVSHGHAVACKQMKRNAEVRIAELNGSGRE